MEGQAVFLFLFLFFFLWEVCRQWSRHILGLAARLNASKKKNDRRILSAKRRLMEID